MTDHSYQVGLEWTGNSGDGTKNYRSYNREYRVVIEGKPDLLGSSDPAFRGDASRHNPEEMLLAALSGCHMLWYLHLCSTAGVTVTSYRDDARGTMVQSIDGGEFTEAVLRPEIQITDPALTSKATTLHEEAHSRCYIARSVKFPVQIKPTVMVARE